MSLKARVEAIEWRSETTFVLDGLTFEIDNVHDLATTKDRVAILKPKGFFDLYAEVLDGAKTRNVLDVGVWQGGSALAFASLFDVAQLSAVDIRGPLPDLDTILASHPLGRRIRVHYDISQDDEQALNSLIATDFDGPLDIVIDDASHHYDLSRRTFEICFPHLAPGGWYVVEDWAWAHYPMWPAWPEQPSLANLTFRLLLAWVASPRLIAEVIVKPWAVFVRKADDAPVGETLALDDLYVLNGRRFDLIA